MVARQFENKLAKDQSGVVLLLGVLIVSVVGVMIGLFVILGSIAASNNSQVYQQSDKALGLAEACAEIALQALAEDINSSGSESVTIDSESCDYEILVGAGDTRTIQAEATKNGLVKRVQIVTSDLTPTIEIESWREVEAF